MSSGPIVRGLPAPAGLGTPPLQVAVCVLIALAALGSVLSPPVANIAVAASLILTLISTSARARVLAVAAEPLGRGALALFAVMTLAMLWAAVPWSARLSAWWNWRTLLVLLLAAAAFGDVRWKERFCLALVAAISLGAIVSFGMWFAHATIDPGFPGVLFRNHVTQSMALATAVLLAATLAWQRDRALGARVALAAGALVCLANLAMISAGRSGQVALVVAAASGAWLLWRGHRRWQALLAVLVLAALLVAVSPRLQQRFRLIAQEAPTLDCAGPENSTGLRLLLWRTTAALIGAHPWMGYGVGGFTPAFQTQVQQQMQGHEFTGWCARPVHDPHNQFLRVTVEAGLLGLLAFFGLIAGAARQRASQPYRSCALALLMAWCTTSLFNSHFQTFNEGHLIALLLGVLLAPETAQAASASNTAARTSS